MSSSLAPHLLQDLQLKALGLMLSDALAKVPLMLLVLGSVHMLEPSALQALPWCAHNHSDSHILLSIGSSDAVDDVIAVAAWATTAFQAHERIVAHHTLLSTTFLPGKCVAKMQQCVIFATPWGLSNTARFAPKYPTTGDLTCHL